MNTAKLRDFSELALAGYGAFGVVGVPLVDDLKILNSDPLDSLFVKLGDLQTASKSPSPPSKIPDPPAAAATPALT